MMSRGLIFLMKEKKGVPLLGSLANSFLFCELFPPNINFPGNIAKVITIMVTQSSRLRPIQSHLRLNFSLCD